MLNASDNEMLNSIGPNTAMGNLFRRFWLPALMSAEISDPDGAPKRLRILKEDLLAFRDSNGNVGIVSAYCSHRSAPLFFGRNEQGGIRCPYHGWKFSTRGACLETPNVPVGAPDIRRTVGIRSYPTVEAAGVVWVYMGPAETVPEFPHLGYLNVPHDHVYSARWLQRSSWLQGLEGEIDSSHISWLHKDFDEDISLQGPIGSQLSDDAAPVIELQETDYGFTYGARRQLNNQYLWRVTHWMMPMFSMIPRAPGPFVTAGGRVWVPIDDETCTVFSFGYRTDRPLNAAEIAEYDSGALFPPRMAAGVWHMNDGYVIDTFLPVANKENDYELCRERQRTQNYSGIWGIHDQDRALAENSRPAGRFGLLDRSDEHLVVSDRAVVTARRRLLKMARQLEAGEDLPLLADAGLFDVQAISKVTTIERFAQLLEQHGPEAYPVRSGSRGA